MIRVGVMGACGRMGREICRTVVDDPELELVAAFDREYQGMEIGALIGRPVEGVLVETDLQKLLGSIAIDVMIDFTVADAMRVNVPQVLEKGIAVVAGTTGLSAEERAEMGKLAEAHQTGMFHAANFAIGAVLMMKFAAEAAKYMPYAEVIELHHDKKLDAPSGTAVTTLAKIAENRPALKQGMENEYEKIAGARGGEYEGMRVHSVRLPGFVASQEVSFGGLGQTLTIRHDSISRESFMPGIALAAKKVKGWTGLVEDLENILD